MGELLKLLGKPYTNTGGNTLKASNNHEHTLEKPVQNIAEYKQTQKEIKHEQCYRNSTILLRTPMATKQYNQRHKLQ